MSNKAAIVPALLLSAHLFSAHANAETDDWIGTIGDWSNPANWADGSPAGPTDFAFIANGGTAVIDHQNLIIGSAGFGLDFEGRFGDGGLIQRGGSTQWGGFGGLLFGRDVGTTGSLTLTDGASLTTAFGSIGLILAQRGSVNAIIEGGSQVSVFKLFLAGTNRISDRTFTAQADLQVRGAGTFVQTTALNGDGLLIGVGGSASMTISDGAVVETYNGLLLSTTAQGSSLTIEGQGSVLRATGEYFDT